MIGHPGLFWALPPGLPGRFHFGEALLHGLDLGLQLLQVLLQPGDALCPRGEAAAEGEVRPPTPALATASPRMAVLAGMFVTHPPSLRVAVMAGMFVTHCPSLLSEFV